MSWRCVGKRLFGAVLDDGTEVRCTYLRTGGHRCASCGAEATAYVSMAGDPRRPFGYVELLCGQCPWQLDIHRPRPAPSKSGRYEIITLGGPCACGRGHDSRGRYWNVRRPDGTQITKLTEREAQDLVYMENERLFEAAQLDSSRSLRDRGDSS